VTAQAADQNIESWNRLVGEIRAVAVLFEPGFVT